MSIQALHTGVSGLQTFQTAIDITSDNIANVNTIGYRGYSAEFASLFQESLDVTAKSPSSGVGYGTRVQATNMIQETGSNILTEKNTDIAINGDGWFGVTNDINTQYTRAGNFTFDANNDLVTQDGYFVLGTKAGNISGEILAPVVDETLLGDVQSQEKLRFPKNLSYPPEPTTNADFYGNLGLVDEPRTISATVVDADSNRNNLELLFAKSATQVPPGVQWDVTATTKNLDGQTIYDTKTGVLNFAGDGSLISNTLDTIDNNGTAVNINVGSGYSGIVVTNAPISGSSTADGTIGGGLIGYEINLNAEVIATFTNGAQSSVGKIALYHFQNDEGLDRTSGTRFQKSSNSGDPIFYQDANGQNILGSTVNNYRLENANVKLETSLTELIIFQRAYDANSKVISTADQMIQKALQM